MAQMEPGAAADIDAARLAEFLDPCGGVYRVAPYVELELRLAHDPGGDRPEVDAGRTAQSARTACGAATMSSAQATAASIRSAQRGSRVTRALETAPDGLS